MTCKKELRSVMLDVLFDRKIDMLRLQYGNNGFAVWVTILQDCYGRGVPSLVVDSALSIELLARSAFVPPAEVTDILEGLVTLGLFEEEPWEKDKVLTSPGLVRRIGAVQAKKERDNTRYAARKKSGMVAESARTHGMVGMVGSGSLPNVSEEEKKEIARPKTDKRKRTPLETFGEFQHVKLTQSEFEALERDFPDERDFWIRELDEGIELKNYRYTNHNLAIRNWRRKDPFRVQNSKLPALANGNGKDPNRPLGIREERTARALKNLEAADAAGINLWDQLTNPKAHVGEA